MSAFKCDGLTTRSVGEGIGGMFTELMSALGGHEVSDFKSIIRLLLSHEVNAPPSAGISLVLVSVAKLAPS